MIQPPYFTLTLFPMLLHCLHDSELFKILHMLLCVMYNALHGYVHYWTFVECALNTHFFIRKFFIRK